MIYHSQLTATISELYLGKRLDKILAKLFPKYSRSCLKKWIIEKRVMVNGFIIDKPKIKMLHKAIIIIHPDIKEIKNVEAQNIKLNIFYEDDHLIIINKPSNMVVHPGAGNYKGTILNALIYHYPILKILPRAGIVHRLDKNTTGLMIVAKNIFIQKKLIELIKKHNIIREYKAIVRGVMISGGCINKPISRHNTKRNLMAVNPLGKDAITHYRILKRFRYYTYICLRLETGRTHQIRVHMSYLNHPLIGDKQYHLNHNFYLNFNISAELKNKLYNFNRQALHASTLCFNHPYSGIAMKFHAPLPIDMIELIKLLKNDMKN
ncbi:MAG: 23S rRNA pseudouridine(1911/1915/1917) synthase RluD [Candidatus Dasytiphilus stammeri]